MNGDESKVSNAIWHMSFSEFNVIKKLYKDNNRYYIVELDGKKNTNEKRFLIEISEKFHFPVFSNKSNTYIEWFEGAHRYFNSKQHSWEICEDWLTDLNWLDYDSIVLIILNYNYFLSSDNELRNYVMSRLKDVVLPWWENDVKNCMLGGQAKEFKIYLVDG